MTNRQIMLKALNDKVISQLERQGFTGKHPHLRREKDNCIEFISFFTNKYGGSFNIEVSAVFPNSKNTNCIDNNDVPMDVSYANQRYRLDGMYDGWFYYNDVYQTSADFYYSISEKKVDSFVPPPNYALVQKFTVDIADEICDEINKQLIKAFGWLEEFEQDNDKTRFQKFIKSIKKRVLEKF